MGKRAEMKEFQLHIVLLLLELMINIYFYTCSLTWLWLLFIKEPSFFQHSSPHLLQNYLFCWGFLLSFYTFWQGALNKFCRRQYNRIWISHSFEFYTNIICIVIRAVQFLVIKWLFWSRSSRDQKFAKSYKGFTEVSQTWAIFTLSLGKVVFFIKLWKSSFYVNGVSKEKDNTFWPSSDSSVSFNFFQIKTNGFKRLMLSYLAMWILDEK